MLDKKIIAGMILGGIIVTLFLPTIVDAVESIPPTSAYRTFVVNGTSLTAFVYNDILSLNSDDSILFSSTNVGLVGLDPLYPDWLYQKTITIDKNQIDADLTDFPVLISIIDTDVRDNARSDGFDILFTDSVGVQLAHEIEKYDDSTGELVVWVKSNLSSSVDTIILLYYGNSLSSNQQDVDNTWTSNYIAVYHLDGDVLDSTSSSRDLTNSGLTDDVGLIGGSQSLDGIADYARWTTGAYPITSYPFTTSAIVETDTLAGGVFLVISDANTNVRYFTLDVTATNGGKFTAVARNPDHNPALSTTTPTITGDVYYSVTGVYMNSTYREIFVNGVSEHFNTDLVTFPLANELDKISLGALDRNTLCCHFLGHIDESRIMDTALSAEWILAEYKNYHNPETFYSISSQITFGDTDEIIISLNSPTASRLGGVFASDCTPTSIASINIDGTVDCGSGNTSTIPSVIGYSTLVSNATAIEIHGLPIYDFLTINAKLISVSNSTDHQIDLTFNNDTGIAYGINGFADQTKIRFSLNNVYSRIFTMDVFNDDDIKPMVANSGGYYFGTGGTSQFSSSPFTYDGSGYITSITFTSTVSNNLKEGSFISVLGWNGTS